MSRPSEHGARMADVMDGFRELLPKAVLADPSYEAALSTLRHMPHVLGPNLYGIEHDLNKDHGSVGLSVSVGLLLSEDYRVDLDRILAAGVYEFCSPELAPFLRASSARLKNVRPPATPQRAYLGFEKTVSQERIEIAGVNWGYGLKEVPGLPLFAPLAEVFFGDVYERQRESMDLLARVSGADCHELGYAVRGGREVLKAYPRGALHDHIERLGFLDADTSELERGLEQLGNAHPDWNVLAAFDVADARVGRVGIEFNFEQHHDLSAKLALIEGDFASAHLPSSLRAELRRIAEAGYVTKTLPSGVEGQFEMTHLKASVNIAGETAWKAYFAFRVLSHAPDGMPILS